MVASRRAPGRKEQQTQVTTQQAQIDQLSAANASLQNQINELKALILKGSSNSTTLSSASGYLQQNVPNPSNNNTLISYYLPDNTMHAEITVTDIKGSVLKVYNASRGAGQVNIRSGELAAGVYNYTLSANNKTIDTKQMVIIK